MSKAYSNLYIIGSATGSALTVQNNTGVILNITSSGYVGIGTASPSTTLDVNGISTFRGAIKNSAGTTIIDINSGYTINDNAGNPVIYFASKALYTSGGSPALSWSNRQLINSSSQITVGWESCVMNDAAGNTAVEWSTRKLYASDGTTRVANWLNGNLAVGLDTGTSKLHVVAPSGTPFIAESTIDGTGVIAKFVNNDGGFDANQEIQIDMSQGASTVGRMSSYFSGGQAWGFKWYGLDNSGFFNSVPMLTLRGDKMSGVNIASPSASWHVNSTSGTAFRVDVSGLGNALNVDSTGNVGIGTVPSSSFPLDVRSTGGSLYANFDFTGVDNGILINATSNTTLAMREAGVNEYVVKISSGSTYIDTKGDYLLRSVTANPLHAIQNVNSIPTHILYGDVYFQYNAVNHGIFTDTGEFGIGTISPSDSLTIKATSSKGISMFNNSNNRTARLFTYDSLGGNLYLNSDAGDDLKIALGAANPSWVNNGQFFGFQTATPTDIVEINSALDSKGLSLTRSGSNRGRLFAFDGFGGVFYLYDDSGTTQVSLSGTGSQCFIANQNFSIGTQSGTARLHIVGGGTSSGHVFKAESLSGTPILYAKNDGGITINSATLSQANLLNILAKDAFNASVVLRDSTDSYNIMELKGDGYSVFRAITINAPLYPSLNLTNGTNTHTIQNSGGDLYVSAGGSDNLILYSTGSALLKGNLFVGNSVVSDSRLYVKGVDSTSANYALKVDSSTVNILSISNNGFSGFGTASPAAQVHIERPNDGQYLLKVTSDGNTTLSSRLASFDTTALSHTFDGIGGGSYTFIADANPTLIWNTRALGETLTIGGSIPTLSTTRPTLVIDAPLVGVGISYPATTAKLHVKANDSLDSSYALKIDNTTSNILTVRNDGVSYVKPVSASSSVSLGGTFYDFTTGVSTATSSESTLYTTSGVAPTSYMLARVGDKFKGRYSGYFTGATTSTKTIKFKFGGNIEFSNNAIGSDKNWSLDFTILYMNSGTIKTDFRFTVDDYTNDTSYTNVYGGPSAGYNFTIDNALEITGESTGIGATAGDIVANVGCLEYLPGRV
jgi:hypothetical protein